MEGTINGTINGNVKGIINETVNDGTFVGIKEPAKPDHVLGKRQNTDGYEKEASSKKQHFPDHHAKITIQKSC
jgi:hypothetical protein